MRPLILRHSYVIIDELFVDAESGIESDADSADASSDDDDDDDDIADDEDDEADEQFRMEIKNALGEAALPEDDDEVSAGGGAMLPAEE